MIDEVDRIFADAEAYAVGEHLAGGAIDVRIIPVDQVALRC